MTPAVRTRELLREIIWWHNALAERDGIKRDPITYEDVFSLTRARHIVDVRHDCMRRLRTTRGWSLSAIGRFFQRDHTTVMSACVKGTMHVRMKVGRPPNANRAIGNANEPPTVCAEAR